MKLIWQWIGIWQVQFWGQACYSISMTSKVNETMYSDEQIMGQEFHVARVSTVASTVWCGNRVPGTLNTYGHLFPTKKEQIPNDNGTILPGLGFGYSLSAGQMYYIGGHTTNGVYVARHMVALPIPNEYFSKQQIFNLTFYLAEKWSWILHTLKSTNTLRLKLHLLHKTSYNSDIFQSMLIILAE